MICRGAPSAPAATLPPSTDPVTLDFYAGIDVSESSWIEFELASEQFEKDQAARRGLPDDPSTWKVLQ